MQTHLYCSNQPESSFHQFCEKPLHITFKTLFAMCHCLLHYDTDFCILEKYPLSLCLYVSGYVCLSVCVCVCLSVCLGMSTQCLYVSVCLCVCMYVCMCVYLCVCCSTTLTSTSLTNTHSLYDHSTQCLTPTTRYDNAHLVFYKCVGQHLP